jgi:hypothetical protein
MGGEMALRVEQVQDRCNNFNVVLEIPKFVVP